METYWYTPVLSVWHSLGSSDYLCSYEEGENKRSMICFKLITSFITFRSGPRSRLKPSYRTEVVKDLHTNIRTKSKEQRFSSYPFTRKYTRFISSTLLVCPSPYTSFVGSRDYLRHHCGIHSQSFLSPGVGCKSYRV